MGCFSSNLNTGILIMYNGNLIELKGDEYTYPRLVELIAQRTEKQSSFLSISASGNAFRINNDKDLTSLKAAKQVGGRILLMVSPDDLLDIFNISLVSDKVLDRIFETIKIKLASFLKIMASFNRIFYQFVQSLSVLFVRSCNISTTITSLLVMLTPYLIEIISDPPYILIPEQVKSNMPQEIRGILTLWEKVLLSIEKIDEHLSTLDNNLTYSLSGRVINRLEITKGQSKFDLKAFKIAENNVKIHKSLEKVRDFATKIKYFKAHVLGAINIYHDRRIQIVKRIVLIGERSMIESPEQASWIFGLGDYSIIPSELRFY